MIIEKKIRHKGENRFSFIDAMRCDALQFSISNFILCVCNCYSLDRIFAQMTRFHVYGIPSLCLILLHLYCRTWDTFHSISLLWCIYAGLFPVLFLRNFSLCVIFFLTCHYFFAKLIRMERARKTWKTLNEQKKKRRWNIQLCCRDD